MPMPELHTAPALSRFATFLDFFSADMEKCTDMQTLSVETFENCGNFWIVE